MGMTGIVCIMLWVAEMFVGEVCCRERWVRSGVLACRDRAYLNRTSGKIQPGTRHSAPGTGHLIPLSYPVKTRATFYTSGLNMRPLWATFYTWGLILTPLKHQ
jgi:hypothetical protein